MKYKWFSILSVLFLMPFALLSQCELEVDEVDPFDSTRLVSSKPLAVGNFIPSLFETVEGPKIIEEAEVMFTYTESDRPDRIEAFFLTIAAPEYRYQPIENGQNVLLALSDSTVIGLHNFPDEGTFDKSTNMRLYQHTGVVPVDAYYRLAFLKVVGIRIRYENKKRTIFLTPEQQDALQQAIQCVGEAVGLKPKP